jgi:prepilin-type N-terminal cleavage/methylation domain-containing protein
MQRLQAPGSCLGFTLVELMIVVAIIGLLASVSIPSFLKYIKRSRTAEATMNVRKIFDGVVLYYTVEKTNSAGQVTTRIFPDDAFSTPSAWNLCSGPGGKFDPATVSWDVPTWEAIHFSIDTPFHYSYDYDPHNVGSLAIVPTSGSNVGDWFEAIAYGDLNCNGFWSRVSRTGTVAADRSIASYHSESNILE